MASENDVDIAVRDDLGADHGTLGVLLGLETVEARCWVYARPSALRPWPCRGSCKFLNGHRSVSSVSYSLNTVARGAGVKPRTASRRNISERGPRSGLLGSHRSSTRPQCSRRSQNPVFGESHFRHAPERLPGSYRLERRFGTIAVELQLVPLAEPSVSLATAIRSIGSTKRVLVFTLSLNSRSYNWPNELARRRVEDRSASPNRSRADAVN